MQASLPPTQTLRTLPLETLEGGTRKIIPFTTDPRHPFKLLFFIRLFQTPLISFMWFDKWRCDGKFIIASVKSESQHPVCLQVFWVWHFLTRCNPRYVTEKSTTDAKSIALIRFPLNFKLLRNLQMLCCKLWPSLPRFPRNVYHHVITFPESREYLLLLLLLITWMKPTVRETA